MCPFVKKVYIPIVADPARRGGEEVVTHAHQLTVLTAHRCT